MGKKCDLSDFDCGMIVGGRKAGLSIPETAGLLGFSCTSLYGLKRMAGQTRNMQVKTTLLNLVSPIGSKHSHFSYWCSYIGS